MMQSAYIGLGSNLAAPVEQVERALLALAALEGCTVTARSGLYRNPPMGPQEQPEFINAVARLETQLSAPELLRVLKETEAALGRRESTVRWGPRIIDLDLLLYGEESITTAELTVPHPGIAARAFVLVPLHEIAPALTIPGAGPVAALLQDVDTGSVVLLEKARTAV